MNIEIERKFLVKNTDFLASEIGESYKQAYLFKDENKVLRIRITENEAYLTIKQQKENISRFEFEYEIPVADAEKLLGSSEFLLIEKKRYKIEFKGKLWEIDVFEGKNKGLVLAEIELNSEEERFDKPSWLGEERSNDPRYFNSYLAEKPFLEW